MAIFIDAYKKGGLRWEWLAPCFEKSACENEKAQKRNSYSLGTKRRRKKKSYSNGENDKCNRLIG